MNAIELHNKAIDIRKKMLDISLRAGSGHFGGSLSAIDLLTALYFHTMKYEAKNPALPGRDRFVLSKGHALLGLAAVLLEAGFYDEAFTENYNGLESAFGMHPNMHYIPGIEMSTGSLGHGLSIGVGMALAARLDKADWRVFVLMGDGENDEGMIWEAAMSASHFKLDNMIGIIDRNKLSLDGPTEEIMNLEPFQEKWRSFGWNVTEIDGHEMEAIIGALDAAAAGKNGKPTLIIANTVKGKGCDFMEGNTDWHYGGLDSETIDQFKEKLDAQRR